MTKAQKIIKYFAIGFAFALILGILSCAMYSITTISNIFIETKEKDNLKEINIASDNVSILDVDIMYANLIIKKGYSLKLETNNKYITTNQEGNKLIIKEKKHSWFNFNNYSDLIIYIPQEFIFDGISIETGAGKIEIDSLSTKILDFDLGAGKTNIDNLIVFGSAEIDGGAGEFSISNGNINNLDLDTGIGKCTLISKLNGNNKIDVGIGNLDITLLGDKNDYKVIAQKGIGSINLNNKKIKSNTNYGTGINIIDISGGIGSINIKFNEI